MLQRGRIQRFLQSRELEGLRRGRVQRFKESRESEVPQRIRVQRFKESREPEITVLRIFLKYDHGSIRGQKS